MNSKKAIKQLKELEKIIKNEKMRLAAEWPKPWQVLISTILSAMTNDYVTIKVCEELFKKYPNPKSLSKARITSIEKIIRPINYHKTKAKNIKKTCEMITKTNNKIPKDINELMKYPGVGRKVANLYLAEAHK